MSRPATLAELQGWLFDRVTERASAASGAAVASEAVASEAVVVVSGRLPASERLHVYRHGYMARLVECLVDDYPALQHWLGVGPFELLCRDFIERHPPPSPSLNYYGAPFAGYCAARPERWSAFASELAQLEWALVEAIHAEEGERLDIAALGQLTPDAWLLARLVPSPALRLLTSTYPIADHYQAFQDGSAIPERWPDLEPGAVAVCRRGADVWRIRLTPALGRLLAALVSGTPLLEALERFAQGAAAGEAPATPEELQRAFQDWVACGLFSRVALTDEP